MFWDSLHKYSPGKWEWNYSDLAPLILKHTRLQMGWISSSGEEVSVTNTNKILLVYSTVKYGAVSRPGSNTERVLMWKLAAVWKLREANADPCSLCLLTAQTQRDSEGKTKPPYIILWSCQPWPQRTTINLITRSMWPNRTELHRAIITACAACFPATASAASC